MRAQWGGSRKGWQLRGQRAKVRKMTSWWLWLVATSISWLVRILKLSQNWRFRSTLPRLQVLRRHEFPEWGFPVSGPASYPGYPAFSMATQPIRQPPTRVTYSAQCMHLCLCIYIIHMYQGRRNRSKPCVEFDMWGKAERWGEGGSAFEKTSIWIRTLNWTC